MAAETSKGGRVVTEENLERAALEQLRQEGVLAGLNLRRVADDAGVNRGLVYHYFGSRRDLLRAALRRDARRRLSAVRAGSGLPLRERLQRFLGIILSERQSLGLTTLLILDGDEQVKVMPLRLETREHLERDVRDGVLDADVDLGAVHAAAVSLAWGYGLLRDAFARELGTDAKTLDDTVRQVFDRMIDGLAPTTNKR